MGPRPHSKKAAFSLLELVIVVVIIGIIAAIAIPRMSRGTRGAAERALKSDLAVMRNAIGHYAPEHGGKSPSGDGAQVAAQLTQYSDCDGNTAAAMDGASGKIYGPYLRAIPPLPVGLKAGSTEIIVETNPVPSPPKLGPQGWWYNSALVDIRANTTHQEKDDTGKLFNEY